MAITRNINDDNTLSYLFQKSDKATGNVKSELDALRSDLVNLIYPVGSIYMSVNNASPQAFLGGTWQRITGRFLLAATDGGAAGGNSNASIAPGNTGGEAAHQLTPEELASHSHRSRLAFAGYSGWGSKKYSFSDYGYIFNWSLSGLLMNGSSGDYTGYNTTATEAATTSAGSGAAHNNMPPYLAVYVWKRTA